MSTGKDKPATSESREWTLYGSRSHGAWHTTMAGAGPNLAPGVEVAVVPREDAEGLAFILGMVALRAEKEPRWCAMAAQKAVDAYRLAHPGPEPEGTK